MLWHGRRHDCAKRKRSPAWLHRTAGTPPLHYFKPARFITTNSSAMLFQGGLGHGALHAVPRSVEHAARSPRLASQPRVLSLLYSLLALICASTTPDSRAFAAGKAGRDLRFGMCIYGMLEVIVRLSTLLNFRVSAAPCRRAHHCHVGNHCVMTRTRQASDRATRTNAVSRDWG